MAKVKGNTAKGSGLTLIFKTPRGKARGKATRMGKRGSVRRSKKGRY